MTYVSLRKKALPSEDINSRQVLEGFSKSNSKISLVWGLLFGWLMLDSMWMYFIGYRLLLPINPLLPILVFIVYIYQGTNKGLLPTSMVIWLFVMGVGYTAGVALGTETLINSFKNIVTSVSAFIIGYNAISKNTDHNKLFSIFIAIGLLYALVCVLALLGVSKILFPVIYAYGFNEGISIVRAEVTIDQNYQIYYLFPPLLAMAMKQSTIKYVFIFLAFMGSLYAVMQLQTRSGLILLSFAALISLLLPVWFGVKSSVKRVWAIGIVLTFVVLFKLPSIIEMSSAMVDRFTNSDMRTFWGRVYSFTYLFENIYKPSWWLPKGTGAFLKETGNLPHSSSTVVFLQGGLLALIAWVALIFLPVMKGAFYIFKKKGDCFTSLIIIGGLISLVAAMSLPAPLFEQLWLWSGATGGALYRIKNKNYAVVYK